jgi:mannose-1-phosphate guanylyltransferase
MNQHYYGVIMAGGVGSRFWPLSRKKLPKQFIDLFNTGQSLFQTTYNRLLKLCPPENIFIVTNESYRDILKEQIPDLNEEQILGEPHARNTAPCIAYAAFKISKKDPKAVIAVLPSDHLIMDEDNFTHTMEKGYAFCEKHDHLLTLGIEPTRPDTGYGYIQFSDDTGKDNIYKVKTFTEKPNQELADYFVKSGEFLWNSGMFIWKAKVILEEMKKHIPELYETLKKGNKHYFQPDERSFIQKAYELCTNISIDYAVMEKSDNVYVIPASFQWSDIGTWAALHDYSKKDEHENVIKGDTVFLRNTQNCIVYMPNKKMVVLNNVHDLIVVEERDGILLIADKNKEQDIRHVVNDIRIRYGEKYI